MRQVLTTEGGMRGIGYDAARQTAFVEVLHHGAPDQILTINATQVFRFVVASDVPATITTEDTCELAYVETVDPLDREHGDQFKIVGPFLRQVFTDTEHVIMVNDGGPWAVEAFHIRVVSMFYTVDVLAFGATWSYVST